MASRKRYISNSMPRNHATKWKKIFVQWEKLLIATNDTLYGVEAPQLFTEWTHVGLLIAALHRSYPSAARSLIERRIQRPSKVRAEGKLDLWINLRDKRGDFDYMIEAKRYSVKELDSKTDYVTKIIKEQNHSAKSGGGQFSTYAGGLGFLIIESNINNSHTIQNKLNIFIRETWKNTNSRLSGGHAVMSITHYKNQVVKYRGYSTVAIIAILVARKIVL